MFGNTSGAPTTGSTSPTGRASPIPTTAFAEISDDPVSEKTATRLRAALRDMALGGGTAATVMSPYGSWSGAVGKADGVRDVRADDQFAIASITKTVVAAQVMRMVEAGELALDDPAADHLPSNLSFDSNGATVRQLLGMRSGIPDYSGALWESQSTERRRRWTPAEVLALVAPERSKAGAVFHYSPTNYVLLGLIIEQVRGRPVANVLRDGVLSIPGVERLIYQPDEIPTAPMAMPDGESTAALDEGGGYLPSLAGASAAGPAGGMASDAPSLARWWRAFCAGEIVSQPSLTEMTTFRDGYGLGLYNVSGPDGQAFGHPGSHVGYAAWAGCLPQHGSIVVVLSNRVVADIGEVARALVIAALSG